MPSTSTTRIVKEQRRRPCLAQPSPRHSWAGAELDDYSRIRGAKLLTIDDSGKPASISDFVFPSPPPLITLDQLQSLREGQMLLRLVVVVNRPREVVSIYFRDFFTPTQLKPNCESLRRITPAKPPALISQLRRRAPLGRVVRRLRRSIVMSVNQPFRSFARPLRKSFRKFLARFVPARIAYIGREYYRS